MEFIRKAKAKKLNKLDIFRILAIIGGALFYADTFGVALFVRIFEFIGFKNEVAIIATSFIPFMLTLPLLTKKYKDLKIFYLIYIAVLIYFAISILLNLENLHYYFRPSYGVHKVFLPSGGIFAIYHILILYDKKTKNSKDILYMFGLAAVLILVISIFQFISAKRRGYWTYEDGQGSQAALSYSMTYGFNIAFVINMLIAYMLYKMKAWVLPLILVLYYTIITDGNRMAFVLPILLSVLFITYFILNKKMDKQLKKKRVSLALVNLALLIIVLFAPILLLQNRAEAANALAVNSELSQEPLVISPTGPENQIETGLNTIDGKTYLYDSNGNQKFGWHKINDKEYYFDETSGVMAIGPTEINGYDYMFNQNGQKEYGWFEVDGEDRYYDPNLSGIVTRIDDEILHPIYSEMILNLEGWHFLEGHERYYKNGKPLIGMQKIGNTTYLFDRIGNKTYGWYHEDGKDYYFSKDENGGMISGMWPVEGHVYLFDEANGYKLTGWQEIEELPGDRLYFDPNFEGRLTKVNDTEVLEANPNPFAKIKTYSVNTDTKIRRESDDFVLGVAKAGDQINGKLIDNYLHFDINEEKVMVHAAYVRESTVLIPSKIISGENQNTDALSRNLSMFLEGDITSDNNRNQIHELVLEEVKKNPFIGLGAFGDRPVLVDTIIYGHSHGIHIELLSNFGLILGIPIVLFFANTFFVAYKKKYTAMIALYLMLVGTAALHITSLSFWIEYYMWSIIAVAIIIMDKEDFWIYKIYKKIKK